MFSPAGEVNFQTVYSTSVQPGTPESRRKLWLGDDKGSLWVTEFDVGASASSSLSFRQVKVENQDRAEMAEPWGVNSLLFDQAGGSYFLRGNTLYLSDNDGYNWRAAYRDRVSTLPRSSLTAKFLSVAITPDHACLVGVYLQGNKNKESLVACTDKPLGSDDPQWKRINVVTQTLLSQVFFIDDRHGWIVGQSGTILKSDNGGKTWRKITVEATGDKGSEREGDAASSPLSLPSYRRVYFLDENDGWIVGSYGTILHSVDGGLHWAPPRNLRFREQISDLDLRSIRFAPDGRNGWIVGEQGTLIHTENGGRDWVLDSLPNESKSGDNTLYALYVDDTFCWAVGHNIVWRSRWNNRRP